MIELKCNMMNKLNKFAPEEAKKESTNKNAIKNKF